MKYRTLSKLTSKLSKIDKIKICKLKNSHWQYGLKSHLKWFKKNVKSKDINNLLYSGSKLIGYTLLRFRKCFINKKINKYLYFDTLIIDKNYRKKKISSIIMDLNNDCIKKSKLFSFLICKKNLIYFYKKKDWKVLKNKNITVSDHSFSTNGMIYNYKSNVNVKFNFYLYK